MRHFNFYHECLGHETSLNYLYYIIAYECAVVHIVDKEIPLYSIPGYGQDKLKSTAVMRCSLKRLYV
nr:MAG TPA: hypothetical protein [Caudoviricetes sp.]